MCGPLGSYPRGGDHVAGGALVDTISPPPVERGNRQLYLPAYRFSEAARFAQTSPQTVVRWYKGYSAPPRHMEPVFPPPPPNTLSYIQLVEVSLVATFRRFGVKLEALRRAHTFLRQAYESEYPFAQHKLKTNGIDVLAEVFDDPDILVVANKAGELIWADVIRERFEQFEYEHDLATRWYIRGQQHPILIDPRISFGAPIIARTGIPTAVIKERFVTGESIPELEEDFGLSLYQVEEALTFENALPSAA